jgi:orotidine-5'-phosphate decarboxylase
MSLPLTANFADRLAEAVKSKGNAVLVGVDPRPQQLPQGWVESFGGDVVRAVEEFGFEVLKSVAPLVPAVKFQMAFYEALGPTGLIALENTAKLARELGLLVIMDGKRNDIGSTAAAYATAYVGDPDTRQLPAWTSDALTINPYLGSEGITPFLQGASRSGTGLFLLVRTSNPSAGEFQDLVAEGKPLYRHVADRMMGWAGPFTGDSGYSSLGAVVGATSPAQLAELRQILRGIWILVPGYGAQGGTAADVAVAFDENGLGAIVNNSRGITFAYQKSEYATRFGSQWQAAVREATVKMIDDLAAHVKLK